MVEDIESVLARDGELEGLGGSSITTTARESSAGHQRRKTSIPFDERYASSRRAGSVWTADIAMLLQDGLVAEPNSQRTTLGQSGGRHTPGAADTTIADEARKPARYSASRGTTHERRTGEGETRKRGARDRLVVGLSVGCRRPRPRSDPPPLDAVVLTAKQAGPGFTRYTMRGGRQVKGQVTLDFCGGGYASEALKNVASRPSTPAAGGVQLSNEVVRYAPGGAAQALREVARRVRTCPRTPVESPVPGNGTEVYPVDLIHDRGLLAGSVAIKMTVETTEDGQKGASRDHRDLPASRQFHVRGLCVRRNGGITAGSALRAAHASADNLLRSDQLTA